MRAIFNRIHSYTTMKTHKIAKYEIVDHGIDNSQYFQGCGVSYTEFDECATGCGSNALEAFDDAMEQIAMRESVDLSSIENGPEYKTANTKKSQRFTVEALLIRDGAMKRGGDFPDDCEMYYYVSIRYSLGASDETVLRSAGLHESQR